MTRNTAERNKQIYERYLEGESPTVMAEEFGITPTRIHQIVKQEYQRRELKRKIEAEDISPVITHEHIIKITPVNQFGLRYAELIEESCEGRGIYCKTKVTKTGITVNYEEGVYKNAD